MEAGILAVVILFLLVDYLLFNRIFPSIGGVSVLMYHKVSMGKGDRLTVPLDMFERQLQLLKQKGYTSVFASELPHLSNTKKTVCLTFDDGFLDNYTNVLPLLERYQVKATFFVVPGLLGQNPTWYDDPERMVSMDELRKIAQSKWVEVGLHTYSHLSYTMLDADAIRSDLQQCFDRLDANAITYQKVFAYPYGKYPRPDRQPIYFEQMSKVFEQQGIVAAYRIGNRRNRLPLRSSFEVTRTEVRGDDSISTFRVKLTKGRTKLF